MTFKLGLLGHPVWHSLSPPMHEAALRHFALEGTYCKLDVEPDALTSSIDRFVADGYNGFNITIPHKDAVYKLASEHTSEAVSARATNTVAVRDGALHAHNTDIGGLQLALEQHGGRPQKHRWAAVIGAGGAARAAIITLARMNFEGIAVLSRDAKKTAASLKSAQFWSNYDGPEIMLHYLPHDPSDASRTVHHSYCVIVNCTPIGQQDATVPDWLPRLLKLETNKSAQNFFLDMVYSRDGKATPLVECAQSCGWSAVDGTDMLIHQARLSFEFWTGELPPYNLMKEALERARMKR